MPGSTPPNNIPYHNKANRRHRQRQPVTEKGQALGAGGGEFAGSDGGGEDRAAVVGAGSEQRCETEQADAGEQDSEEGGGEEDPPDDAGHREAGPEHAGPNGGDVRRQTSGNQPD